MSFRPPLSHTHTDTPTIFFTGEATITDYESLLLSLSYTHTSSEPTPGTRTINITLTDGNQHDSSVVIVIVFVANDNHVFVVSETAHLLFTEGDVSLAVGEEAGLRLIDEDFDPEVVTLQIVLEPRDSVREILSVDSTSVTGEGIKSGPAIFINQTRSLQSYQVSVFMFPYADV